MTMIIIIIISLRNNNWENINETKEKRKIRNRVTDKTRLSSITTNSSIIIILEYLKKLISARSDSHTHTNNHTK